MNLKSFIPSAYILTKTATQGSLIMQTINFIFLSYVSVLVWDADVPMTDWILPSKHRSTLSTVLLGGSEYHRTRSVAFIQIISSKVSSLQLWKNESFQSFVLQALKRHGIIVDLTQLLWYILLWVFVVVFSHAGWKVKHGKTSIRIALFFGMLSNESVPRRLLRISHKSRQPVKSVDAVDIFAEPEALDEFWVSVYISLSFL